MPLDQKDIELIERIVYKNNDDVAISISRSFERLEERMDAAESRIYTRLADLEQKLERDIEILTDDITDLKDEVRESSRFKEPVF